MQQKTVTLAPGVSGVILVRAKKVDASGNITYSDYASYNYSSTGLSPSGGNTLSTNTNGDVVLAGGSIYAGSFPNTATGAFDPKTSTTTGSGVILNQYGLSGYASGTREFYIDSRTGNAYFSGTIQATVIESNGYTGPIDGLSYSSSGMAINLNTGTFTSKNFRIQSDGSAYFAGNVSGAIWSNTQTVAQYIGSVSQAAANGKNTITYGSTSGTGTNGVAVSASSGFAPDGNVYYSFPSTVTYSGTNQQVGDTFFSYNSSGNIIAQYTATSSSSWQSTQITSQVISSLDVGKLTAGTISAAISMTSATISGGTIIGGLIETVAGSTQKVQIVGSSTNAIQFTNSTGGVVTNISPLVVSGTTYGTIINAGSSPDTTFANSDANIYVISGEVRMNSGSSNGSNSYITVNGLGASISAGSGRIAMSTSAPSTTPNSILLGGAQYPFANSIYSVGFTVSPDPGGTPSGGSPGSLWLYY